MFDCLPQAPPDAILGLTDALKTDPNPRKINLSVGVYKDEQGNTPILACVKEAERRLLATEKSKGYLSIEGHSEYASRVQELLFGPGHEVLTSRRAVTAQTPGRTGSLRLAADLLQKHFPQAKIWLSQPTCANHAAILRELARPGRELRISSSFSKNFGLYGERVGALTLVAAGSEAAQRALSQVRISIRTNYSNPPTHGAAIVATVLADAELRKQWEQELAAMRDRIHQMRRHC